MDEESQSTKDTFEKARNARDHDVKRMSGDDERRAREIHAEFDRLRAEEIERHVETRPIQIVGEKNRLRLEHARPDLRPEGVARKPLSEQDLTRLAENNVDRRHEGNESKPRESAVNAKK